MEILHKHTFINEDLVKLQKIVQSILVLNKIFIDQAQYKLLKNEYLKKYFLLKLTNLHIPFPTHFSVCGASVARGDEGRCHCSIFLPLPLPRPTHQLPHPTGQQLELQVGTTYYLIFITIWFWFCLLATPK